VDETLPEAGVPYSTHGGETLREIAREAYGDESMVLALVAIHGCGADRVLPKGAQITLPAPAIIASETLEDAALLEEKGSRASMAAILAGTESHHNIMHSAMDALNGSTTRNIDRSTPFSLADTDPNVRPETERSTILGAELDRELRGLKTIGHEISTQTEGDAEVHFETTNTATIGNPDRERPDATLDAEGRDADADPELMDAFTPFKADDIENLELDRIKDQAKLDVSSIEKKAVNRADGSSLHIEDVTNTTHSRLGTTTGEKKSTVTDTAADGSSESTTTSNKTFVSGSGNVTLTGSSESTSKGADGSSTTAGGSFVHGKSDLSAAGKHAETTVDEDGSTHTTAQSGGIDLTSSNIRASGRATVSDTAADGTSTSDTVGGNIRFEKDGTLSGVGADHGSTEKTAEGTESASQAFKYDKGVVDIGVKSSSTTGTESTTHADNIKIDTNKGTVGLTDAHTHTVKDDDGGSVGITSKNTLDINAMDPSIKGSTEESVTVTNADGSKTTGRGTLSGGLTSNSLNAGIKGGATVVDADGDALTQDHSLGLDLTANKTTLSGTTKAENLDKNADGGHDKIGGSAAGGVTIEGGEAAVKASAAMSGEKKTIGDGETTTVGGRGGVAIDTAKRDVSVSAGVSHDQNVKGRSSKAMGKVGISLQDGVRAEATYAVADPADGTSTLASGGLHIGRDGKPALVGDIEFTETDDKTGVKTGHGIGGGISAKNLDIGYRYSITRPDGHLTTAYVDVAITRDKARGLAGISDMQATTVGDVTTHVGGTGALLVGADDITVVARNNQIITQGGSILPTAFTTYGGFASFRGKQITTVGEKVADEKSPNFGEYKVETSRKIGGSAGADFIHTLASVSGVPFGIGGSLALSADREVQYSTHLSEDRTKTLAELQTRGKLKHRLAGATLIDAPIKVPDLSEPSEIQVGDRVKVDTRGSIDAGIFGSIALFAQAGVRFNVTGDFELTVEKPAEDIMEVEYIPTRVIAAKLFTDAFIADASLSQALAQQIGQKFRFDMSTEAGRRGYQAALKGNLPGGLTAAKLNPAEHNLRKIDREFAPGVERLKVSRISSRQRAAAAKAGWLFLTSGVRHSRTRSAGMVSDGKTTANQKTFTYSTERRTILSGNEENGISGSLNFSTVTKGPKKYDTSFDGYTATAYFADTKVRGDEYASHMLRSLNKDLGSDLVEPAVEEAKGLRDSMFNLRSRRVEATARFTPQDIVDIRETESDTVVAVAKQHGVSETKINALITKIKESEKDVEAATHLDQFLASNGRSGLGVLIKLARMTSDDVIFSTESGFYEGVITDAGNYLLANAAPATAGTSKKDLGLRYKQGEKLHKDVIHGLDLAADDPILDLDYNKERKDKLVADLDGKREALEKAIDFEHLSAEDALSLWLTLDRGWTTGPQGRCQEKLLKDAGITLHGHKYQSVVATSVKEEEDSRHEVSIRTRQKALPLFGDERTQVSAAVDRVVNKDGSVEFKELTLETRIIDQELRWKGMNNAFVKRVNSAYGTDFSQSKVAKRGEQQLILRQVLQAKDLVAIVDQPEASIVDALKASGLDEEKSKKFGGYISRSSDAATLIRVIEHFIQDEGVTATGAIHRIAGLGNAEPQLYVDSVSGAIKKDIASIDKTIGENALAVEEKATNKDIAARFKKVTKAQKTLEKLEERVEDYPFYNDAQREELNKDLGVKTESLAKSLNLSALGHTRAVDLYSGLDRGWTRASSYKAMDGLKKDTGLLGVSTNLTRNKVSGETVKFAEDHSSTFYSSIEKRHWNKLSTRKDKQSVTTTVERTNLNEVKSFNVAVEISESKVTRQKLQDHFLKPIREGYSGIGDGADFPNKWHDRSVKLGLNFNPWDILTLRQIHETEVDAAIKGTDFSKDKIQDFLFSLRIAPNTLDQGRAIAGFVNKHGFQGLGMLNVLLNDGYHVVKIDTTNGLLDVLKDKIDATMALYEGTSITDDMTKKELTLRFKQLEKAEERLDLMIEMVTTDPLMGTEEKESRKEKCEVIRPVLRKAFNPDDLDREGRSDLIKVLEKGWTTGRQHRIIEELKYRNVAG
jgi:hypothetical protein